MVPGETQQTSSQRGGMGLLSYEEVGGSCGLGVSLAPTLSTCIRVKYTSEDRG